MTKTKIPYFDMPTQVEFFDFNAEEPQYIGGIAYRDEIICSCCGGIIELDELYAEAKQQKMALDNVLIPYDWMDLNALMGARHADAITSISE